MTNADNTKHKSNKATAIAPSNIAFIKYWGKKDEKLRIPENGSIAMTLDKLVTTTTVEFGGKNDEVSIDGEVAVGKERERVVEHLDRVREMAGINERARVVSDNSFPKSKGLSSSASGFAALTMAATVAAGLKLSEKELSMLARLGSGSACRSIPSGFVEWMAGSSHETSYARTIYPVDYWDLVDIVVITDSEKKHVATSEGQTLAASSPFYEVRLGGIEEKLTMMKGLLAARDFTRFGQLCESEALEMHAVMLTSKPPLLYWQPASVRVMRAVAEWREEGLESYFTLNTGQDVHVLCLEKNVQEMAGRLQVIEGVVKVVACRPGQGADLVTDDGDTKDNL